MYGGTSDVEPTVQAALASLELHSLSTDELKTLLNEDDQLAARLQTLSAVQSLRANHEATTASNRSLAEYNLSQEPRLLQLKTEVRARLEQIQEVEAEIRDKRDKLSVVDQPLDMTLALLQTAAAEAEEESENLIQSMLGGEMSLDNFLELYLPKRRVAISRRVKVDKLKELIRSGTGVSAAGYRQPAPAPAPYPSPAPAPTPYPAAGPTPYPPGGVPYPTPYPSAAPGMPYPSSGPPGAFPYMPGGMPMPRY